MQFLEVWAIYAFVFLVSPLHTQKWCLNSGWPVLVLCRSECTANARKMTNSIKIFRKTWKRAEANSMSDLKRSCWNCVIYTNFFKMKWCVNYFFLPFRCVCSEPEQPSNETLQVWRRMNKSVENIAWSNLTVTVSV